ncbi:MAG: RnfABCDGE type electron transport complex subunit B [Clostridia bacterium]|nr:RnfABCDGE type electron transport complex subunit B [Clostridia bacterium]
MEILIPALIFAGLGAAIGILLAVASKAFAVPANEKAEQIAELLPGANCGGCGYSGCAALAEAIAEGKAKPNACAVGGDAEAAEIAKIMGVAAEKPVRLHAQVMCSGCEGVAKYKFEYEGVADCKAAMQLGGGSKTCPNGCLGLGSCVAKCQFNAISIVDGIAVVDREKCKACGMCVATCPKNIIKLIPFDSKYYVGCVSTEKGAVKRAYCDASCIGCKMCEKACPTGAIAVENFVAKIDYEKCINCGACVSKCPRKIIRI